MTSPTTVTLDQILSAVSGVKADVDLLRSQYVVMNSGLNSFFTTFETFTNTINSRLNEVEAVVLNIQRKQVYP